MGTPATLEFTATAPARKKDITFTENLMQFRAGSDTEIIVVQQRIGHGTTVHFLGPGDQLFSGMIRVAEATNIAFLDKHDVLMSLQNSIGIVTILAGTPVDDSARRDEEHDNMLLSSIIPTGTLEAGNEFVSMYTLTFVKLTLVGQSG